MNASEITRCYTARASGVIEGTIQGYPNNVRVEASVEFTALIPPQALSRAGPHLRMALASQVTI